MSSSQGLMPTRCWPIRRSQGQPLVAGSMRRRPRHRCGSFRTVCCSAKCGVHPRRAVRSPNRSHCQPRSPRLAGGATRRVGALCPPPPPPPRTLPGAIGFTTPGMPLLARRTVPPLSTAPAAAQLATALFSVTAPIDDGLSALGQGGARARPRREPVVSEPIPVVDAHGNLVLARDGYTNQIAA